MQDLNLRLNPCPIFSVLFAVVDGIQHEQEANHESRDDPQGTGH